MGRGRLYEVGVLAVTFQSTLVISADVPCTYNVHRVIYNRLVIYNWLSRSNTARASGTGPVTVSPTKLYLDSKDKKMISQFCQILKDCY